MREGEERREGRRQRMRVGRKRGERKRRNERVVEEIGRASCRERVSSPV